VRKGLELTKQRDFSLELDWKDGKTVIWKHFKHTSLNSKHAETQMKVLGKLKPLLFVVSFKRRVFPRGFNTRGYFIEIFFIGWKNFYTLCNKLHSNAIFYT